jgi:hypothetical protein
MNSATKEASQVTSVVLREYIEHGGVVEQFESIHGNSPDETIHVFTVQDRDGTYISNNAGVAWIDSDFDRVVSSVCDDVVVDLPDAKSVSKI